VDKKKRLGARGQASGLSCPGAKTRLPHPHSFLKRTRRATDYIKKKEAQSGHNDTTVTNNHAKKQTQQEKKKITLVDWIGTSIRTAQS
jgi:hypothetical protein